MSVARDRLSQERKAWRKDKPFGFIAKPEQNADGSVNLMKWVCSIPGKPDTDWEGAAYPLTLHFPADYPNKPPECFFPPGFFHPNVYPAGKVCLSIINPHQGWKPSITVKQVLVGIQDLLDSPNNDSPAQWEAHTFYTKKRAEYHKLVRQQAKQYPPAE